MRAGHSNGSITERYIHAAQVAFPGAAERAENRIFSALEEAVPKAVPNALSPDAQRPPKRPLCREFLSSGGGIRTHSPPVNSRMLYR
jgi:hypothetical protein